MPRAEANYVFNLTSSPTQHRNVIMSEKYLFYESPKFTHYSIGSLFSGLFHALRESASVYKFRHCSLVFAQRRYSPRSESSWLGSPQIEFKCVYRRPMLHFVFLFCSCWEVVVLQSLTRTCALRQSFCGRIQVVYHRHAVSKNHRASWVYWIS